MIGPLVYGILFLTSSIILWFTIVDIAILYGRLIGYVAPLFFFQLFTIGSGIIGVVATNYLMRRLYRSIRAGKLYEPAGHDMITTFESCPNCRFRFETSYGLKNICPNCSYHLPEPSLTSDQRRRMILGFVYGGGVVVVGGSLIFETAITYLVLGPSYLVDWNPPVTYTLVGLCLIILGAFVLWYSKGIPWERAQHNLQNSD